MKVASAQKPTVNSGLVLTNVIIVDTHAGKLTPEATVVIEEGRITRVVEAESVAAGGAAQRIDGHGRFLIPGYWDMHAIRSTARISKRIFL